MGVCVKWVGLVGQVACPLLILLASKRKVFLPAPGVRPEHPK